MPGDDVTGLDVARIGAVPMPVRRGVGAGNERDHTDEWKRKSSSCCVEETGMKTKQEGICASGDGKRNWLCVTRET